MKLTGKRIFSIVMLVGAAVTVKWSAAAAATVRLAVAAKLAVAASAAVMVCVAAVFNVVLKVPTPLVRALLAASTALVSVLVK